MATDLMPGATHIHKARIQPVNSPEGVFACCMVEDGSTQVESDTIDVYTSRHMSCFLQMTEYVVENRFDLKDVDHGSGHHAMVESNGIGGFWWSGGILLLARLVVLLCLTMMLLMM
jgi:hypothetical protein